MRMLCFETGGTKLVASTADASGELLEIAESVRKEGQSAAETIEELCRMGRSLEKRPDLVVWGFGGTVDRKAARPADCFHESGWGAAGGTSRLKETFQAPLYVENDCNLAALAEALRGFEQRQGGLLYVTLGTGVGAGFVREGKIAAFGRYGEMELGHIVVEEGGVPCPCGNRGCLEMYCSGPSLARMGRETLGPPSSSEELMRRFRAGDPKVEEIVQGAATHLGSVLAAAVNLLAPDRIILGGGVMQENQDFLDRVRAVCLDRVFPVFRRREPDFALSRLGRRVVCQGAALWGLQCSGRVVPS